MFYSLDSLHFLLALGLNTYWDQMVFGNITLQLHLPSSSSSQYSKLNGVGGSSIVIVAVREFSFSTKFSSFQRTRVDTVDSVFAISLRASDFSLKIINKFNFIFKLKTLIDSFHESGTTFRLYSCKSLLYATFSTFVHHFMNRFRPYFWALQQFTMNLSFCFRKTGTMPFLCRIDFVFA